MKAYKINVGKSLKQKNNFNIKNGSILNEFK